MNKIILVLLIIVLLLAIALGAYIFVISSDNNGQPTQETIQQNFEVQGMKVEVLVAGSGVAAVNGDKVKILYRGTLENGTDLHAKIDPNYPFEFTLGENKVIKGWDLGVLGMKVGEKRKLTIPPQLAYGSAQGGPIPANSTVIYEVELLKIN